MNAPTITDLRTAVFARYPFRCNDCGIACDFRNPQFEYTTPGGERVMLHNISADGCLCGKCLAKRIRAWFANPVDNFGKPKISFGECEICHKEKTIAETICYSPVIDCRFGSRWWNGHWICCDCLASTAIYGQETSGVSSRINSETFLINEAGARIYR